MESAAAFQGRIESFRDEYLKSETGPVPFGGRDREIARLDTWLADPTAAPRLLITSPAGRGKSALLVHWIEHLHSSGLLKASTEVRSEHWHLIFVPISIRFGTNSQTVFYQAIADRLAAIVYRNLEKPAIDAATFYADQDDASRV